MDLVVLVRQIGNLPGSALNQHLAPDDGWGLHEENTARLLDIEAYKLDLDWAARTADPDDAEARSRALDAKRRGVKPPPRPIIPPIAGRPPALAEREIQRYLDQLTQYGGPPEEEKPPTLDDWETAHGLT